MTDTFDSIRDHLSAAYRALDAVAPDLEPDRASEAREVRDSISRLIARVNSLGILHRAARQEAAFTGGEE